MAFTTELPYTIIIGRLALALLVGLFVGLERERRGKESGVRTFALGALLGCLGGLLGETYALLSLLMLGLLITLLNLQTIYAKEGTELTTSIAFMLTGVMGILSGQGHTLIAVVVAVTTVAMLAWKQDLAGFSLNLSETELRAAILLAILAFVIYPVLPEGSIDPWQILAPREAFVTVILIAGIGFFNYILWKIYGTRGIELTSFLAGLVNSSVTVSELASRVKETGGQLAPVAYRGILLATAAMLVRNGILLAILSPLAFTRAAIPLSLMLLMCSIFIFMPRRSADESTRQPPPTLHLESPFSLPVALRFGLIFLILQVAGAQGQNLLGELGVYVSSFFGGLFSSSSAVAAAASLQTKGTIDAGVAAVSAIIASATSVMVHWPLLARAAHAGLTRRLGWVTGLVIVVGVISALLQQYALPGVIKNLY
jgi:uncharacterized membrane protein (DUF4010 family)